MLIVDDLFSNFKSNEFNGIPIKAFVMNKKDNELPKLFLFL